MASRPIRLLVGLILAGGLALIVFVALPHDLDVRTDIVGYPTLANFNINRYLWAYGLTVVFFPLSALGVYLLLTRAFVGRLGPWGPIPRPLERVEAVPTPTGRQEWLVGLGRTLFVGGVFGFEAAIALGPDEPLELVALVAVGYGVLVLLGALVTSRVGRGDAVDFVSIVNILAAPLAVGALYSVSESTEVTVGATGVVHGYPWLPLWLAAGATAALLAWFGYQLARGKTRIKRSALERQALLLVVAPVGLFLFVASLPGALGTVDFFEEGQVLAASELTREGAFPWRDLFMAHGLLHDVGSGLLGAEVFENSRWGVVAGQTLLIEPLVWVALYYLCTYLFGANWVFLLGTQLLVFTEDLLVVHIRFLPLPVVLLLLAALLRRPTVVRGAAFTTLLAVQVVVTPEALAAAVAYLGALVLFELYYYQRGRGLTVGFRRTWLCLATAAVLAACWSLFLLAFGALDDWIFSFRAFLPGHQLAGGIPRGVYPVDELAALAPIVLVLAVFAFLVVRTRLHRSLALQDWVMLATGALTLLYYTKFLSRIDPFHLDHSFSVAVPLLFYAVYRAVTFGEAALVRIARARGASWFPARHTLTVPLLFVLLATASVSLRDAARAAPLHFGVTAPREPELQRVGYDRPGENDTRVIRDISRGLESLLAPGETVFDFSNAPGLFHYLLDLPSSTRYYHVSLAIRQRTQTDLVRLLEENRPGAVVFTNDGEGEPMWDGIANQVRHYDVSQYLLDHYVPVLDSHGFVLMARRDDGAVARPRLYFSGDLCNWGYVPNFFIPEPDRGAESLPLELESLSPARLAVTLPPGAAGYGWLELRTGDPLREGRFELSDRLGKRPSATRGIFFNTLDRGERSVRVRVGSCSQWRGYRPGVLYLTSSVPQDVREVRLLR